MNRKQPANVVAIIPARGGSKGLPRKNILPLMGKPLVAYSILAAKDARYVDRIVVSTEDSEIAAVAQELNVEVVARPPELATDEAPTDPVLEQVLCRLEQDGDYRPELVVLLQPTSPLRPPGLVDACIDRLMETNADSLLTVFEGHQFYWRRRADHLEANYDPTRRPRRQDIPEEDRILMENGSVYVTRREVLVEHHGRLAGKVEWYVMSPDDSLEIDEPIHLQLAESLLRARQHPGNGCSRLDDVRLVVLDFDGVLTDNRVWVSEDGSEAVACDRSDGMGLSLLQKQGIAAVVLSTETNPVVAERCRKLGVPYQQGLTDKSEALLAVAADRGVDLSQVAYVGNDINDLGCMRLVGCAVAVADAHPNVVSEADLVLSKPGGHGAVRELCDMVLSRR